ncbi:hypothetical protein GGX14DRAFT_370046 [Mycena pura]|uniref:Uncharacterized protein n=1 Tax=Mycena pura TaxID=153505 RepID=A0AAD6V8H6_9AGAR|nr:hypothetical protein GGX14DRAFT_369916 [Mycena pura]KAJ7202763.1 hypothetical protein GGX14DRAFT_370046 [Mycena pura]
MEIMCPDDAPAWIREGVEELSANELGPEYRRLVNMYIALERAHGFVKDPQPTGNNKPVKLVTGSRPPEVGLWIKRYRTGRMDVKNVPAFESKWWKWWALNQPAWRGCRTDGRPEREDARGRSWGHLLAHGQNGFLSVVATLYWWGSAEQENGDTSAVWLDAVRDVTWVVGELILGVGA